MTKYEWEEELGKHISVLPPDEAERIKEYYNELFADNIERGMSEKDIVREFGNPFDVARRILEDYDFGSRGDGAISDAGFESGDRAEEKRGAPDSQEAQESKSRRNADEESVSAKRAASIVLHVLMYAALGAVAVSVFIGGIGAAIGGVADFVMAFVGIGSGVWVMVARLGFAIVSVGVGVLLGVVGAKAGQKIYFKAKRFFGGNDVAGAKEQ